MQITFPFIYLYHITENRKKKRQFRIDSRLKKCLYTVGLSLPPYLTPKSANWRIALFLPVKCTAWSPWALASATLSRRSSIKTALDGWIWKSLISF